MSIAPGVDSTGKPHLSLSVREAFWKMCAFRIEYADAGINNGVDSLGKKIEEIRRSISI